MASVTSALMRTLMYTRSWVLAHPQMFPFLADSSIIITHYSIYYYYYYDEPVIISLTERKGIAAAYFLLVGLYNQLLMSYKQGNNNVILGVHLRSRFIGRRGYYYCGVRIYLQEFRYKMKEKRQAQRGKVRPPEKLCQEFLSRKREQTEQKTKIV